MVLLMLAELVEGTDRGEGCGDDVIVEVRIQG